MISEWTRPRLERLFARYNARYWDGRLGAYAILVEGLDGPLGRCERREHTIRIDIGAHPCDRAVRDTLLHEMAHAADRSPDSAVAHGRGFWREVERLLRRGAPISVGDSEMPGLPLLTSSIPRGCPLCRAAVRKLAAARTMEAEKKIPPENTVDIDEDYIMKSFADAAVEGLDWRRALLAVGSESGLLDVDFEPIGAREGRILKKARIAHRNAEGFYLIGRLQQGLPGELRLRFLKDVATQRRCIAALRLMRKNRTDRARAILCSLGVPGETIDVLQAQFGPKTAAT